MKVIIDAGSTKSDVAILHEGQVERFSHDGMNPVTDTDFVHKFNALCAKIAEYIPTHMYYYGSGCINETINNSLSDIALDKISSLVQISVDDDLIGAAKATLANRNGIICILGTGSNAAFYDGSTITKRTKSGGYLLGDEGSGFRIGQSVYLAFARGWLSREESEAIAGHFNLQADDAIAHLYAHPNPRTLLASFAEGIKYLDENTRMGILNEVFTTLSKKMLLPLTADGHREVYFVGSIAHHFEPVLKTILAKEDLFCAGIMKSPIEGLINYHL